MKHIVTFALIALIALAGTSCKKGPSNHNSSSADSLNSSVPATQTGALDLLVSTYAALRGVYVGQPGSPWGDGPDNWIYGSVAGGDAHKGSNSTDQSDLFEFQIYGYQPNNDYLTGKWNAVMYGLHHANAVLNELPLIKDGSLSPANTAEIKAEARFLRGVFELELAKIWHNAPYIDETVPYNNGYTEVSNPGPIWDKIEADFTAAMDGLPTTQAAIGRANKYAAEAFMVKTLMFDHKYSQAQPLVNDLINNGQTAGGAKYSLVHYADNFNASTKNGPEGVFVIESYVHDGSNGYDGNPGDILNFPAISPQISCCGFFQPSFSFVNAFKTDANTGLPLLDTYNNTDLKNDEGLASSDAFTPTTATVDSRLDWSVGRRGIPYLDWGIMPGQSWMTDQLSQGPYVNIKSVYYQGQKDATTEAFGGWATNQSTSNSYNAIRFADVLLWGAEIAAETGNLQQAEDYVNRVRARAADPIGWVHTYADPANPTGGFTNTPAANYKVGLYGAAGGNTATGFTANGQAYARKAIYFERMLELGMEGHRFFDLQRWDGLTGGPESAGFMAATLNDYLNHEKSVANFSPVTLTSGGFTQGKNEYYPIPQAQIDMSKGKMKQNPGY